MALTYLVIVEAGPNNLSAYVPDISGCMTTGPTITQTLSNLQEALQMHIAGMIEDGDPIPFPATHQVSHESGDSVHHIAINVMAQVLP